MADNKIDVGGRLHSIATGNVLAGADEILDDDKGKKQSEINVDVDNALADRYTKDETYNKNELNSLITTPNVQYVTVSTYSQLPATGSADTIYKVSSYDGTAIDATKYAEYAWDGSGYVLLSVKSAVDEIFDISVFNAESGIAKKYETLTTALAGIPSNRMKGGMSIKFIQSSDNKYVQFRCMAQSFTTDTTQWAICDDSVLVECPEYVAVYTDADGKIIVAVENDGNIHYGAGVPKQVIDYITAKIAELSLDEYEDIVTFLGNLINGDKTLAELLNEKVDKVEGKSLIDEDVATGVSYVENPEFIYIKTDKDNKILWAIRTDGYIFYGAGVPPQVVEYVTTQINSIKSGTDSTNIDGINKIIAFLDDFSTNDTLKNLLDKKVDKVTGKSLIQTEVSENIEFVENPDFIDVKTDSEGKILEDITSNGRKEINIPIDIPSASLESVDNPEYIKAEIDKEGRVIGSRKVDGTLVENVGIETKSLFAEELNLPDGEINALRDEMINGKGLDYVHEYPCVRDAAKDGQTGVIKVGSELYTSVVDNPSELTHKQDAYTDPYYDANSTLKQYVSTGSRIAIPENICNRTEQEEIDFTPSETGLSRIIVGKSSSDVFFIAKYNCNYGDGVADTYSRKNCLEITSDFVTFTPIFKAHNAIGITGGLSISEYGTIIVRSVKEFANGDFIVAANCWYGSGNKTCFFILKKDFSAITPITCTYLDGTTGLMMDEFNNNVYDWHIAISGSKALVTTYGSRQPATDYGRVWYTEDNGVTWKQIFQMTNHYQDGVSPNDPPVTQVHTHGVMIDEYDDKLYVIAGEDNANLFWSDKGWNTTDNDWNVISIRRDLPIQHQSYMQVVNGYAFATNLIFGSDCSGAGAIYRLNKLGKNSYSEIQVAHEFLPNKLPSTMYCGAGMYRRDNHSPLFFCETRENCMPTEEQNEILEQYHKARVVATYDGVNFTEIWTDDTFGTHETYISSEGVTTRKFSYCGRDMNFYLLKNGDAVIKYIGRNFNYFGGTPMYSVQGNTKGCCKVRWIKNVEKYL